MSTYTVTAPTLTELRERMELLMRFGWAVRTQPHKNGGVWEATLYIH